MRNKAWGYRVEGRLDFVWTRGIGCNLEDEFSFQIPCDVGLLNKEVVLRDLGRFEIKFVGDKKVKLAEIIFVLKARKLIRKWHTVHLVHVIDTQTPQIDLDIFLQELTGLPSKKEIEFTVEVVLGTTTISQILYCVTPSKLKELKNQWEELVENFYIRLSTSPWGAPVLFVKNNGRSMRLCIDYF